MRAREVRTRLKGRCDPQVSFVVEAIAERQSVLAQQLHELAQMIDLQTSIMQRLVAVGENMRSATDRMNKMSGENNDDLGPVTR